MSRGPSKIALRTALAEVIQRARKKCGFSQEELAWRSGLHRTYISMVERAQRSLTIDTLEKIALALGTSGSTMLGRAEAARRRSGSDEQTTPP